MAKAVTRPVVAVVDDDDRILESLADLLESAGYAVRLYSSARVLLEQDRLSEIDCLISDIGMPGIDGFELRRLARAQRPDLPIFLITGRPEIRHHPSAVEEPERYFEKPFDAQKLLDAIAAALNPPRRQEGE